MNDKRKNKVLALLPVIIYALLVCTLYSAEACAQADEPSSFTILFYNVENLFDTQHDSLKNDEEFLPDGIKHWTFQRYNDKINKVAKVILAANQWHVPDLIGLCEIENNKVLNRLIWETGLNELNYHAIHYESPDVRGIDVALLYRSDSFKPLQHHPIDMSIPDDLFFTRDLLYVKGIINSEDTIHLLICHWPSKLGGELHSEWKRIHVAKKTREVVDSVYHINPNSYVIVMGDLNESVKEKALSEYLLDIHSPLSALPYKSASGNIHGSNKYQGIWNQIDHILVSKSFFTSDFSTDGIVIIDYPFLLQKDESYSGFKPYRSYAGPQYLGGFSDHLPVKVSFQKSF